MAKHSIALIVIGGHEDKKGQRDVLRAISEGLSGGQLIIATIASPCNITQRQRVLPATFAASVIFCDRYGSSIGIRNVTGSVRE